MNLILEFYSVSIVSMYQIFSAHKGTQRSNFETPSLINPKKKTSFLFKVKKKVTYQSIFPIFEAYFNSMPSLKHFL